MKRKGPIKAIIFDLDGTLLDTLEDLKNGVNAALREYHLPQRTLEEVRRFVGNGVRNLMIQAVPGGEEHPKFEEILAFFQGYYKAHCKEYTGPYQGISKVLKELDDKGILMAIVSNKFDPAVKELNEEHFGRYIKVAIGETLNVARKPAPDMVYQALDILGVEKSQAVYIGDSEVDIQTAKNAGLFCIAVTWGFRDEELLRECGAESIVHTPEEMLGFLLENI